MPLSFIRYARMPLLLAATLAVAACSNNSNRAITPQVGVDTGVTLSTAGSATSLLTGRPSHWVPQSTTPVIPRASPGH